MRIELTNNGLLALLASHYTMQGSNLILSLIGFPSIPFIYNKDCRYRDCECYTIDRRNISTVVGMLGGWKDIESSPHSSWTNINISMSIINKH